MIKIRCLDCNREVTEGRSCGCPNMVIVKGDTVTAVDLTRTIMVSSSNNNTKEGFTSEDLKWQEKRRQRKVRKLNFETR
tara:strand:+ start:411 stop:647 length:237 start_codon:yes stop_codon:yes gene_type:complete